jgi:hypothetical protein
MTDLTIGQIVDGLGVKPTINDGDLISGVVVLLEVVEDDGSERLSIAWSEGMSWMKRTGMLHHALAKEDE